jgi:hypothetical protein
MDEKPKQQIFHGDFEGVENERSSGVAVHTNESKGK